jgi:2'-5' RNA ligase
MRCFIAIDIEEQIREALVDLQKEIMQAADVGRGDVKWVRPDSMHLTLKFLGEVSDQQLVEVCKTTNDVAGRHEGFEIDVGTVGCFGGRSARVLWVGAGLESEPLLRLQQDLDDRLEEAGWPREARKFSAHLTLCRIKNAKAGLKMAEIAEQYEDFDAGVMSAQAVSIYESQLTPAGPIYTLLSTCELRQP